MQGPPTPPGSEPAVPTIIPLPQINLTGPPPSQPGTGAGEVPYNFTATVQNICHRDQIEYVLRVAQQPQRARMVGSGEKSDRRPIDPPPIVQLKVLDKTMTEKRLGLDGKMTDTTLLYSPFYLCIATLCLTDGPPFTELKTLPNSTKPYVVGAMVSSLFHLREAQLPGGEGHFFVFGDLGVRVEGQYRLKMTVYEVVNEKVFPCATTHTEPFEVFSAKKFPGMEESTELSRTFANQGIRLRVRSTKSQPQQGHPSSGRGKATGGGRKKQRVVGPLDHHQKTTTSTLPAADSSPQRSTLFPAIIGSNYATKINHSSSLSSSLPSRLPSLECMLQGVLPSHPASLYPPHACQPYPLMANSAPHSPASSSPSSSSSAATANLHARHAFNTSSAPSDSSYVAHSKPPHSN